jgi:hypothetical protein
MARLHRPRTVGWPGPVAAAAALAVYVGCSPPPQRKPIEMQPIGTVDDIPRTVDDLGPGDTTTPNSGTPSARTSECAVGESDDLEATLKECEVPMPKKSELPSPIREKLELRVTASTPTITGGGQVDLTVFMRNKSKEPLPLFFTGEPDPRFEVEALDAKGRRVDIPTGKHPAYPKGYSAPTREAKASRVTLLPGAAAKVKVAWVASKMRWAPEKLKEWDRSGYPRVPSGDLSRGKYTLRVSVPLIGVFEKGEMSPPKTTVEVTK